MHARADAPGVASLPEPGQPRQHRGEVRLYVNGGLTAGPEGIDLHHPEASVSLAECTKCGECRDACPAHAISFPLLARTEKA
ncbi:MAG: 4Fe-4S binding protein, partial [Collinsella intestinalis]